MNKKIMIFFLTVFGSLLLLATFLFIKNQGGQEVIEEEPKIKEPQNSNDYIKIADADLKSDKADVHTLVKYGLGLYGLATDDYEIEGDLLVNYGTISKLTDVENIPINELETNSRRFYGAIIVRISYEELVVQQDDVVYKFYRIGD